MTNVKAAVKLSGIDEVPEHSFIVVEPLISQVILGADFLQQQGLVLDFTILRSCQVPLIDRKRPATVSTVLGPARLQNQNHCGQYGKQSERGEQRCVSWHPWKTQLKMRLMNVQSYLQ